MYLLLTRDQIPSSINLLRFITGTFCKTVSVLLFSVFAKNCIGHNYIFSMSDYFWFYFLDQAYHYFIMV